MISRAPAPKAQPRKRKAVVPPKGAKQGMNLFDYLAGCTPPLDKKIIDIAMAQTGVHAELRDDAAQEIRLMWSHMTPDIKKYKPGQIAAYAHRIAKHAALRLRRELGSTVRLPGSAFRKRKDGSSYVTPGVLTVALDWNALENWFQTDDLVEHGNSMQALMTSGHFPGVNELLEAMDGESAGSQEDEEEEARKERVSVLEAKQDLLTERQYAIMSRLVNGLSYEEIQRDLSIKKGVLMRELAIASSLVGPISA